MATVQASGENRILIRSLLFASEASVLAGTGLYSLPEHIKLDGINLRAQTGLMYFWLMESGRLTHFVSFPRETWPQHFDISPDGTRVAVIFYEVSLKDKRPHGLGCYSFSEKKWLWKWKWSQDEVEGFPQAVKILPGGRRILVLGYQSIWYYDVETGQKVYEWRRLLRDYVVWRYALRTSYLSPSGRYLVIWQEKPFEGGALWRNRDVTVWDLERGKEISRWKKPTYECVFAKFSPDEENIVFGCKDGYVREWSIRGRAPTKELKTKGGVYSLLFSPDGRLLSVESGIGTIAVFDYLRQKEVHQFAVLNKGPYSFRTMGEQYPMAFSSQGEYFALLDKGKICLYSTSTWEQKWCVDPKPPNVLND